MIAAGWRFLHHRPLPVFANTSDANIIPSGGHGTALALCTPRHGRRHPGRGTLIQRWRGRGETGMRRIIWSLLIVLGRALTAGAAAQYAEETAPAVEEQAPAAEELGTMPEEAPAGPEEEAAKIG